jgi:predicted acyltransferase
MGHVAARNWATLGLRGTRVMGVGQSAALSM